MWVHTEGDEVHGKSILCSAFWSSQGFYGKCNHVINWFFITYMYHKDEKFVWEIVNMNTSNYELEQ